MNALELSKLLRAEGVAVISENIDVEGMDRDSAQKLRELVDTLVPSEEYMGYVVVDGRHVVFKRAKGTLVVAVVEENRLRWCLNRMRELQW